MTRRALLPIGLLIVAGGLGAWCAGATGPQHTRGLGPVELGDGRAVRLWVQPHFGDPDSVWFEATRDGQPLRPKQCLGTARSEYVLRTLWMPDGRTSCTVADDGERPLFVYIDWPSGEVWPGDDAAFGRWVERRQRLTAAHPDLPADRDFAAVP